jgi:phosphoribosylformylglycinamidine synthase subunit PurQ / glutaminase
MKVAVILFPGTNCENESKYVLDAVGIHADIVRWNEPVSKLSKYDGYLLPGGWSYEDRIRAGVIAAKGKIMEMLREQDKLGKPIIGICNGCQILAESGLVPDLKIEKIEIALAPNINPKVSGYYCTWVHVKKKGDCIFTSKLSNDEVIPLPIAHGEGRFTTNDKKIIDELVKNKQIIFTYCDENGIEKNEFPINPNGTMMNIAGISNKKGNVLAMMPHPERASFNRQLKLYPLKSIQDGEGFASAIKIFQSMNTGKKGG